jgi:hypothetical protein
MVEALGREAAVVLPAALRTRELTVRLPRYQLRALEVLAGDGRESVEAMLTRMFEELAELHQERLARTIPGVAEAMAWPEGEGDRNDGRRPAGPPGRPRPMHFG